VDRRRVEGLHLVQHPRRGFSDVVLFDIERLLGNEVFLRTQKNGGEVFAYVPDWLRDRLRARATRCGAQPFMISKTKRLGTVTNTWRKKPGKVFEAADIGNDPGTPHTFPPYLRAHPAAEARVGRGGCGSHGRYGGGDSASLFPLGS
jgi:hypothetical protein